MGCYGRWWSRCLWRLSRRGWKSYRGTWSKEITGTDWWLDEVVLLVFPTLILWFYENISGFSVEFGFTHRYAVLWTEWPDTTLTLINTSASAWEHCMELKWQTLQEIYPEGKMVCAKWRQGRVNSITTINFQKTCDGTDRAWRREKIAGKKLVLFLSKCLPGMLWPAACWITVCTIGPARSTNSISCAVAQR